MVVSVQKVEIPYILDVYIYLNNLDKEIQTNLGLRILSLPYLKFILQTQTL